VSSAAGSPAGAGSLSLFEKVADSQALLRFTAAVPSLPGVHRVSTASVLGDRVVLAVEVVPGFGPEVLDAAVREGLGFVDVDRFTCQAGPARRPGRQPAGTKLPWAKEFGHGAGPCVVLSARDWPQRAVFEAIAAAMLAWDDRAATGPQPLAWSELLAATPVGTLPAGSTSTASSSMRTRLDDVEGLVRGRSLQDAVRDRVLAGNPTLTRLAGQAQQALVDGLAVGPFGTLPPASPLVATLGALLADRASARGVRDAPVQVGAYGSGLSGLLLDALRRDSDLVRVARALERDQPPLRVARPQPGDAATGQEPSRA
jgi:hypothetical protein